MRVHKSALKHGVDEADSVWACRHPLFVSDLDDDSPSRQLRIGFDRNGRLLEAVVLQLDDGGELVIHAMEARKAYRRLL